MGRVSSRRSDHHRLRRHTRHIVLGETRCCPTYKRGFGFHPLGAWCDTTGEPVAAMLRPGNAGSNDADHHLELLDQARSALPPEYQLGHDVGDTSDMVVHPILVRADSAGATHGFVR